MMQTGALKVALAMAGIFVAGVVAGGVGGIAWERHQPQHVSEREFVESQLERLEASLELTGQQIECMKPIMCDFAERVRTARRNAFTDIAQVWREINAQLERELTPHQLKKFRAIQALDLERWEKEQHKRCSGEAAPGPATAVDPDGLKLTPP